MWKGIGIALTVSLALLTGYVIRFTHTELSIVSSDSHPMSYADFIAILLTGLGVIIAVASIGLAVAGVVGWRSIEGKAMRIAEEAIRTNINDSKSPIHRIIKQAISDPASPLHKTLKVESQKAMFSGIQPVATDNDEPTYGEEEPLKNGDRNAN